MTSCEEKRDDRYLRSFAWPIRCRQDRHRNWVSADAADTVKPKDFDVPFASVLENAKQLSLFVDMDSDVLGGTPRILGTRIPVHRVLNAIEEYGNIEGATKAYRSLTLEQVRDAVQFAAHVLEFPVEYKTETAD
jgi:uncharacterized protein (DUF433 family)